MLALRPGVFGLRASYVELLAQVLILLSAGYVVYSNRTLYRVIAFALVFIASVPLLLIMIPLYGEAFVAP
ncbi:hypothetical protein EA473_19965 [Natrarchaeobius chitinivorans]|uniref:Uncharacterized protein n=1 Tax=Natrarchaeobius chitinivorans TaxID=1679083 RepID=A0A3N6LTS2_NATCH|nr:hypothetical protein EA473_19965 [Natrarchaeobius chitinivorans]